MIGNVIEKILTNTEPLESSLLFTGNLIAQYFYNISKKIEVSILETIVRRIYKFKMPSVVQSMVLVYSRLLIIYPQDIFSFLTNFTVENRVGLKVLIDKWLLHQPLFRGKYFKNLSIKALTVLFSLRNPIIESLMVIGYDPSHSNASIEINAPLKILSVLIRCLNREILQEKAIKGLLDNDNKDYKESNYEDEYLEQDHEDDNQVLNVNVDEFYNMKDEEDYTTKEINSKLHFLNQGRAGGLKNIEAGSEIYLSEMLVFDYNDVECDDDDNVEEDLVYLRDIDVEFDLKEFIINFFSSFIIENEDYLNECLKIIPKKDQEMYKAFEIKQRK